MARSGRSNKQLAYDASSDALHPVLWLSSLGAATAARGSGQIGSTISLLAIGVQECNVARVATSDA